MKSIVIFAVTLLGYFPTFAQTDTTGQLPDTLRTNSSPDPRLWYNSELPKDAAPAKDSVLLDDHDIPHRLKKALDSKDEFAGWRKGELYFDRINQYYKLFLRRDKNMNRFTLNEQGKIISVHSYIAR